ncbi:Radial spoke head 14-like protein [Acropora cervicornis]|uniref:Radial spoke head 14-like protein n=1 Tax=Acropora cervicornis TaxID=6130 RepID=A0AAD9QVJ3_ACRCE|nr:Radial spoke head 14-like protein [Acropora cervicornis]
MAHTVISVKLPPNIDPTKSRLAYGDRELPKLNRELNSSELLTRQRALMSLCDVMHNPEKISEALRVGHAVGRDAFLDHDIIVPLSQLFDDNVYQARRNAHKAIEMCVHMSPGTEGVVDAKLVPVLVAKLLNEEDEIKELILDTLHYCMTIETLSALESGAMESFTKLLSHTSASIRSKAARDVMDLRQPGEVSKMLEKLGVTIR